MALFGRGIAILDEFSRILTPWSVFVRFCSRNLKLGSDFYAALQELSLVLFS